LKFHSCYTKNRKSQ